MVVFERPALPLIVETCLQNERAASGQDPDGKKHLAEWKSGDMPYVVDAVAPFGDRKALMAEFQKEIVATVAQPRTH